MWGGEAALDMHLLGAITHVAFFQSRETVAVAFDSKRVLLLSLPQLELFGDPLTLPENQYCLPIRCRHITAIHSPSVSPKAESTECCKLYVGTSQGVVSVSSIPSEWKFGVDTLKETEESVTTIKANALHPKDVVVGHDKGTLIYWNTNVVLDGIE